MLLSLLKSRTAPAHDRIEQVVPLMRSDLTLDRYVRHLERLFGFYAPLEPRLLPAMERLGLRPDERAKLPRLARDLRTGDLGILPLCAHIPDVSTLPAAVGCLYVLEGSTLGGQLLARHLHQTLPQAAPFHFLDPYGRDTGAMWRAFREAAEASLPPSDHDAAARAAEDTFVCLERWLTSQD